MTDDLTLASTTKCFPTISARVNCIGCWDGFGPIHHVRLFVRLFPFVAFTNVDLDPAFIHTYPLFLAPLTLCEEYFFRFPLPVQVHFFSSRVLFASACTGGAGCILGARWIHIRS